jgi:hypothetical protein
MPCLFVRQKVKDYDRWYKVFASHAEAQKEAGLRDLQLLRDVDDPNVVVCFFRVDNMKKARSFTEAPEASEAQTDSGMIGEPQVMWLNEI